MIDRKQESEYREIARSLRKETIEMIFKSKSAHIGSSFSIIEILVVLYFKVLNLEPNNPTSTSRDRFILSKGHGCPALYATLKRRGFLDADAVNSFALDGGSLEQHPRLDISQGIEASSGSLGHGLSIGCGIAFAEKLESRESSRAFVLMSDGETNEGSVWEAAMLAAHKRLDNLIAIIDYNKIQALGRTEEVIGLEPYAAKWRAFGWSVKEVDGHNIKDLLDVFEQIPFEPHKPCAVIAHTVKGKGVSFMEDDVLWHYRCPDENEYKTALQEIG